MSYRDELVSKEHAVGRCPMCKQDVGIIWTLISRAFIWRHHKKPPDNIWCSQGNLAVNAEWRRTLGLPEPAAFQLSIALADGTERTSTSRDWCATCGSLNHLSDACPVMP